MARKRYMEEAERVMLLMYSVYYNETGQIADSSKLKGAMTRGRGFAQAAIDKEIISRLGIKYSSKMYLHPGWNQVQAQVFKEIEEDVHGFWLRQQHS
ncbi:hypothetical protein KNU12_gp162 [Klebsiella phage KP179]|uniref:Uncharacterized protein n=1 Tax=Klebsiella phage KP179 TaxID=2315700 RepID=A0A386K922_9CAUD|nr:hypothetical protein KNU12_gp162 [Klebsiella phage KP179]AYD80804.1 hypothetical protein [Klebsiella phage KP179]